MRPKKKKCATTSNAPTALVALLPPKATTKKTWTPATLLTSTPIKNAPFAENEKVAEITKKTTGFARDAGAGRNATTAEVPSVIRKTLILAGRMTVKSSGANTAVKNTWKNTSAKGTARTTRATAVANISRNSTPPKTLKERKKPTATGAGKTRLKTDASGKTKMVSGCANHPPLGRGLLKYKHISRIKWPVDSSSLW